MYDGVIHEKHEIPGDLYTHYYDTTGSHPLKTLCGIQLEFPNPNATNGYSWGITWIAGQIDPDIPVDEQEPSCQSCKRIFRKQKGVDTRAYCGLCHKKYVDVPSHLFKVHRIATKSYKAEKVLKAVEKTMKVLSENNPS